MFPGPGAVALDPRDVGEPRVLTDCLVLRVVVEAGDNPLTAAAADAIRGVYGDSGAACVVLAGSAHLADLGAAARTHMLTRVADTLDVLSSAAERLRRNGIRVRTLPFGWQLAWRAEMSSAPGDVRGTARMSGSGDPWLPVPVRPLRAALFRRRCLVLR
ncbi:threonyl-tRNA synthetase editing domain-containing protein [Nocardia aurantia]|uniref:threonyl-tRNA synthetase editing domain-containing protein n=1 Tax=Nocardia aurantia TaxID=2585199 RepID=UPI001885D4F2|nr:threonyl-tRNA synthetase editing domain-containing protein [Nocardia aurantia]